jgi:hypothetical protein
MLQREKQKQHGGRTGIREAESKQALEASGLQNINLIYALRLITCEEIIG